MDRPLPPDRWERLVLFLVDWRTRWVASWCVTLAGAGLALYLAWTRFDVVGRGDLSGLRRDGNEGHTFIDFGGQWVMGRMIVEGRGRQLYDRRAQHEVLIRAYPRTDEAPAAAVLASCLLSLGPFAWDPPERFVDLLKEAAAHRSDADRLLGWFMTADPEGHVGGPLYPPIHAVVYAPLGLLRPQVGYRALQILGVLLAFVAGLGIRQLAAGRIWWPVATLLVLVYPGFNSSLDLGQNAALTLTILVWGWVLISRQRPGWGGAVWGLLAFKPVWAAAFFLVPLLTRRWRACLTMSAVAAGLALATVPVVGWESWRNWLAVGQTAARLYNVDENWVFLSRDLLGIPRRFLLDFTRPIQERDRLDAAVIGWGLLSVTFALTSAVPLLRPSQAQAVDGPIAAFLLLGAWLCCFHFMYYDVLLTALPLSLLFTRPRDYLEPRLLAIIPVDGTTLEPTLREFYRPRLLTDLPLPLPWLAAEDRHLWTINRFAPTVLLVLLVIEHVFPLLHASATLGHRFATIRLDTEIQGQPWHTYVLMVLWLYCGIRWWQSPTSLSDTADVELLQTSQLIELRSDVACPHQALADQDGTDPGSL
ncbi:MAG: DUF2029 domain-containing protein [Gemmataceae bacterium]|nr:DUF2029 domain-containing protein [Gemmataceae bacterium]MDW8264456.1 glycosyltransferase family 87 protein [Gemmataceae bacterium]